VVVDEPPDAVAAVGGTLVAVTPDDVPAAEVLVIALQNEHEPLADRIRSTIRQGIAVGGPTTAEDFSPPPPSICVLAGVPSSQS
jgi:hypothetical protein